MFVKRFLETKLFNLLSCSVNGKEINDTELPLAYDDFVRQLLAFCREEQDIILYHKLHSSRDKRFKYATGGQK